MIKWIGRWEILKRTWWQRTDAHIWWVLTIQIRYQWISGEDLAKRLHTGRSRTQNGLNRLVHADHIEHKWCTDGHGGMDKYRALEPKRAEEADDGDVVFFGAY
jgi:predicted transcriptional regulator